MIPEILVTRRPFLLRQWLDAVQSTYAPAATCFARTEQDRFANPVGHMLQEAAEFLLDRLLGVSNPDAGAALERFMRLQAVQGMSGSQAVGAVLLLKRLLRSELTPRLGGHAATAELLDLDERIDGLAMLALDHFVACREQMSELRTQESRRKVATVLARLQGGAAQLGEER